MCHRKFFLFVFLARKQEVVCGFQFLCHPVSVYKQADRPYACHPFVGNTGQGEPLTVSVRTVPLNNSVSLLCSMFRFLSFLEDY